LTLLPSLHILHAVYVLNSSHHHLFFLLRSLAPCDLHSFPTRRSSDLVRVRDPHSANGLVRGLDLGLHGSVCTVRAEIETAYQTRSEEHTSELQSRFDLVCRLLLEKKKMQ